MTYGRSQTIALNPKPPQSPSPTIYPTSSVIDLPVCYLQSADGTIQDLGSFCRARPTTPIGIRVAPTQFRQGSGWGYAHDNQN